jgi:hypothetical protein
MAFRKKASKAREKAPRKAPEAFGVEHLEDLGGAMELAEETRNLTQEIINSFDARMARVAALKHETAAMLRGFREEFRRKAADLKRFLSNAEASRMRNFRAMHQGIEAQQEARSRQVGGMLSGLRREREAAAGHWRNMVATMANKRASAVW